MVKSSNDGPLGVWKSTLAKLMLGFQQAQKGNITINGKDLRHLSVYELRHYLGVVLV